MSWAASLLFALRCGCFARRFACLIFVLCVLDRASAVPGERLPGFWGSEISRKLGENEGFESVSSHLEPVLSEPRASLRFKTEPRLRALAFDIIRIANDTSALAPGYIFLTPLIPDQRRSGHGKGLGGQIYDIHGNLVWQGFEHVAAQDLNVCDYLGEKGAHLCLQNHDSKNKMVLNQQYEKVGKLYRGENGHEFYMINDGRTFVQPLNTRKKIDMTPYTGRKEGHVLDGCFVEIDAESGKWLFEWCYLDHLPVWETTMFIKQEGRLGSVNRTSSKAQKGTFWEPWDFFHINSIDKHDGDYIISGRHMDQIYKIAGPENRHGVEPGTVLWRLGGRSGDFTMDFTFSKQHHVRFREVTANETVISLFDNAWEGTNPPTADSSSAMIVNINNATMQAKLLRKYPHPDGALSEGRGSTQLLPNGNVFVGYGRLPDIVEHAADGSVLYHARFSTGNFNRSPDINYFPWLFTYRAFKHPWAGTPAQPPKLLAYSRNCSTTPDSPLTVYVSWNGATEVASWRFTVSSRSRDGPWIPAGTFAKTGFETHARLLDGIEAHILPFSRFVSVEALDADGRVLGAAIASTFVPRDKRHCGVDGCTKPAPYLYLESDAEACATEAEWDVESEHGGAAGFGVVLGLVVALEAAYLLAVVVWRRWRRRAGRPARVHIGDFEDRPGKLEESYSDHA